MVVGCTSEKVELLLDLDTDLVPGVEFTVVRTERFDHLPRAEERAPDEQTDVREVTPGERWDGPTRIAELAGLEPGRHYVRVQLLTRGNEHVQQRVAALTVRETSIFTITMSRSCSDRMCPGPGDDPAALACVGDRCVPPACTEETPEHCPAPACTDDAECAPTAPCATARCSAGACLSVADDTTCASTEWCNPDDGCTAETRVLTGSADGTISPYELVVGPDGQVTMVGTVIGSVDLGEGALPAPPARGMIFAGYADDLTPLWGRIYAASDVTEGRAIALRADGSTVATGYYLGSGTFGTTMVSSPSGQDTMILEHDPAGNLVGIETYPTMAENAQGRGLDVASDGAVAMAGVYGVDVTIGGVALPVIPASATDWGFFAVVDPPSVARWAVHVPGAVNVLGDDVAFFSDGSVCAVGRFDVDVVVDVDTRTSSGDFDGFVARFDAAGVVSWVRSFGGPGYDAPSAAAAIGDGCAVTGRIEEGAAFEGELAETGGGVDGFVARYDVTGALEWVRVIGGPGTDDVHAIAPGPGDSVLIGGEVGGTVDIGDETLTASGKDALVAGIASDGSVMWARTFGGDGDEAVATVGYDFAAHRVAVAVRFAGATRVGRHEAVAVGRGDAFLHWLTP